MNPLYLIIAYVCLLHAGPLLNLIGLLPGRVFPITTAGHLLMVYLAARYFTFIGRKGLSRLDMVVTLFVFWSLTSFVLYFQKDNPTDITAYAYGVHLYLMPMFGYYAVKMLSATEQVKALRFILWSNLFLLITGLYLWWAKPAFYTEFLRGVVFAGLEDWNDWQIYARLQSYLASTVLGVICAVTAALPAALRLGPWQTIGVLSVAIPSVVLTYQRGGQAATLLAILFLVLSGKGSRMVRVLILGASLVITAIGMVWITETSDVGLSYYIDRKNDYNVSVLEGRRGYTVGVDYVSAFPLGVGLGGSGNAAVSAGLAQWDKVVDANFMRIFADLGVQGLLMFLLILAMGTDAALRRRKNAGLASIVLIYALVAVGTNVFDGHMTPQLFWLILGMCDTPEGARAPARALQKTSAEATDLSPVETVSARPQRV